MPRRCSGARTASSAAPASWPSAGERSSVAAHHGGITSFTGSSRLPRSGTAGASRVPGSGMPSMAWRKPATPGSRRPAAACSARPASAFRARAGGTRRSRRSCAGWASPAARWTCSCSSGRAAPAPRSPRPWSSRPGPSRHTSRTWSARPACAPGGNSWRSPPARPPPPDRAGSAIAPALGPPLSPALSPRFGRGRVVAGRSVRRDWRHGPGVSARAPEPAVTGPASSARATIVTVDDDPAVSRSVARDLRRRYGERHRIVRAESGDTALDALRQMKLRGDLVAVILADYRMPEMNGIEFLERAMDIYPGARRALLTAYADTGAAIDAINVVDLDYYLLKPWDPPEEKLYPVVDALLDAWLSADHRPVPETKVVGHRWSARSSQVREFLARNQVPYRWYGSDEPEGRRLLEAAGADGMRLPLVVTPDGEALIEPSDAELASRVGLATTPSKDFYDLIVIGGGPAGLGAAVYGASEGLRTVLVERTATGGQAGQSSRIENYLGFPDGVSGAQP